MKILGWIFVALGLLSGVGAASAGNSVFGPLFWVALGAFLLYRASSNENKKEENYNVSPKQVTTPSSSNNSPTYDGPTDIADIHSSLTTNQKECIICLIAFFSGFSEAVAHTDQTAFLIGAAGKFIGIDSSPANLQNILTKHLDGEETIKTVTTIKNKKIKEFIILTCYDLAKRSKSSEAYDFLYNIADNMGFSKEYVNKLVTMYS